jgi:FkbM family methyltransferase
MNSDILNLQKAEAFFKASLVKKVINKPGVFAKLQYYLWAKKSKMVTANLFWGGKMNVVLPEVVSSALWKYNYFDIEVCYYLFDVLKKGSTFVDVGAHFGFFSLMASHIVKDTGKVVSVDPTPSTFELLSQNLNIYSNYKNFSLFNNAAFETATDLQFYDFGVTKSAYNSLFGSRIEEMGEDESNRYRIIVKAVTVDSIVENQNLQQVDLIKIDAESAEINVVKGLHKTIAKFKPSIIMEIGDTGTLDTTSSRDLIKIMEDQNYVPHELRGDQIVRHQVKDDYSIPNLSCYNILFIHKDKL